MQQQQWSQNGSKTRDLEPKGQRKTDETHLKNALARTMENNQNTQQRESSRQSKGKDHDHSKKRRASITSSTGRRCEIDVWPHWWLWGCHTRTSTTSCCTGKQTQTAWWITGSKVQQSSIIMQTQHKCNRWHHRKHATGNAQPNARCTGPSHHAPASCLGQSVQARQRMPSKGLPPSQLHEEMPTVLCACQQGGRYIACLCGPTSGWFNWADYFWPCYPETWDKPSRCQVLEWQTERGKRCICMACHKGETSWAAKRNTVHFLKVSKQTLLMPALSAHRANTWLRSTKAIAFWDGGVVLEALTDRTLPPPQTCCTRTGRRFHTNRNSLFREWHLCHRSQRSSSCCQCGIWSFMAEQLFVYDIMHDIAFTYICAYIYSIYLYMHIV